MARDNAVSALNLIGQHERVCAERAREAAIWRDNANDKLDRIEGGINNKIASLSKSISSLYGRMWAIACALVGVLLAVIAYLIIHRGL